MKTVYLHIGMHKTATTAIQICLRKNERVLTGLGYSVPRSGVSGTTHNNIAFDIRKLPRYEPDKGGIDELVNEISTSSFDRFIVSAEALDHCSAGEIDLLGQNMAAFDVKVIVFLRRQVEWLQSEWSEMVKLRFYRRDFATWMKQRVATDPRLRYFEFLEAWADIFQRDNIRVRVFERSRFQDRNVFIDFLEACDVVNDRAWDLAGEVNVSPSIKTLEVLRSYVHHYRDILPDKRLLYRCKKIVEFADLQGWNKAPLNLIDRELFSSCEEMFRETNSNVAETYLLRDTLFRDGFRERPITQFDIDDLEIEELFRLIAYLES